jgi:hypothetical protein
MASLASIAFPFFDRLSASCQGISPPRFTRLYIYNTPYLTETSFSKSIYQLVVANSLHVEGRGRLHAEDGNCLERKGALWEWKDLSKLLGY